MLLLDSHVWLWGVEAMARRIGPRSRRLSSRAETRHHIRISPVSIFEIVVLQVAGRVRLTRPVDSEIAPEFGPRAFAAGTMVILAATAIAAVLPSLRTTRIDPATALRVE